MLDVVALGELLIDFAPISTDAAGYPALQAQPGGAPGNFLAALQKYGCRTALLGKVGADSFGRLLVRTAAERGIETRGVVADPAVFTTLAFVTLDATGNREFSFARKPGADTCLTPEEVDKTLIDEARVFHFGTLSLTGEPARAATQQAVAYAKEKGKLISFDPNLRKPLWESEADAKEQIEWGLRQADVVKISDEEISFLWGLAPEAGAQKLLAEYGVQLVYATLGPKGCFTANAGASAAVESPAGIRVVDTTGAGDIFGGSAMSQLLPCLKAGRSPAELTAGELRAITPLCMLRRQPFDPDPRRHQQRARRSRRAGHSVTQDFLCVYSGAAPLHVRCMCFGVNTEFCVIAILKNLKPSCKAGLYWVIPAPCPRAELKWSACANAEAAPKGMVHLPSATSRDDATKKQPYASVRLFLVHHQRAR